MEAEPTARWHLRLMGTNALYCGDARSAAQEITLPRRKARLLLAYLALHPEGDSRRSLCRRFWSEDDCENILSVELSAIRRCFRPQQKQALVCQGSRVRLNPALVGCDVGDFESLLARARHATSPRRALLLRLHALRLYRRNGVLLPDEHETAWVNARREELEAAYQQACYEAAQGLAQLGRVSWALAFARALAARAPRNTEYRNLADSLADEMAAALPHQNAPGAVSLVPLSDLAFAAYHALPDAERHFFAQLCLCEGAFTLEAAQSIHQARKTAERAERETSLAAMLRTFARVGIVEQSAPADENDAGMFSIPAALRSLGAEQLNTRERESLLRRHARRYFEITRQAHAAANSAQFTAWFKRIEREYAGIQQALQWFLAQPDATEGVRIMEFLEPYWSAMQWGKDARRWLYRYRKRQAFLSPERRSSLLYMLGNMALQKGRLSLAFICYRRSLTLCQTRKDALATASAFLSLGRTAHHLAKDEEAIHCFEQSLRLYESLDAPLNKAEASRHLGTTLLLVKADVDAAQNHYEAARRIFDAHSGLPMRAAIRYDLAEAFHIRGDYPQAIACINECFQRFQKLNDQFGVAQCLMSLGVFYAEQGQFALAVHLLEDSCARLACHDIRSQAAAWGRLAEIHLWQGETAQAQALLARSGEVWQKEGHARWLAWIQVRYSQMECHRGRFADALQWAERSLANYERAPAPLGRANALDTQAAALYGLRQLPKARLCLLECLTIRVSADNKKGIAQALESIARSALAQRDWRQAARCLGKADALRKTAAVPLLPIEEARHQEMLRSIKSWRGWKQVWTQGRTEDIKYLYDSISRPAETYSPGK